MARIAVGWVCIGHKGLDVSLIQSQLRILCTFGIYNTVSVSVSVIRVLDAIIRVRVCIRSYSIIRVGVRIRSYSIIRIRIRARIQAISRGTIGIRIQVIIGSRAIPMIHLTVRAIIRGIRGLSVRASHAQWYQQPKNLKSTHRPLLGLE
jgi:hypothetical protein